MQLIKPQAKPFLTQIPGSTDFVEWVIYNKKRMVKLSSLSQTIEHLARKGEQKNIITDDEGVLWGTWDLAIELLYKMGGEGDALADKLEREIALKD